MAQYRFSNCGGAAGLALFENGRSRDAADDECTGPTGYELIKGFIADHVPYEKSLAIDAATWFDVPDHGRPYALCRSVSRLSRDGMGSADQRRTLSRSSQCYSWIYAAPTRVPRERHYAAPMILSAGHYGFTTILTGRSMLSVSSRCLRGRSLVRTGS